MEYSLYLDIIRKRIKLILGLVLSSSLFGLLLTYVVNEQYETSATIFIKPREEFVSTEKTMKATGYPITVVTTKGITETYSRIMESTFIAKLALDKIGIENLRPPKPTSWYKRVYTFLKNALKKTVAYTWEILRYGRVIKLDDETLAIKRLTKSISAEPIKDTYLFNYRVRLPDPQLAASVANTVAEVFTSYFTDRNLSESGKREESLLESIEMAEGDLLESRKSLTDLKGQHKTASIHLLVQEKTGAREHFLKQLNIAKMELAGLQKKKKMIEEKLAREDPRFLDQVRRIENEEYSRLKSKLHSYQSELAGLETKYAQPDAKIDKIKAEIAAIQEILQQEDSTIIGETSTKSNPFYILLKEKLLSVNTEIEDLEERKHKLKESIAEYDAEITRLTDLQDEISDLEYRVHLSQEYYQLVHRDYGALKLNQITNPQETFVVDPAVPPSHPSYPVRIMFVGIAAFVALVIGLAIAFFLEFIDTTVRSIEQAETLVGAPVLATISDHTGQGSEQDYAQGFQPS